MAADEKKAKAKTRKPKKGKASEANQKQERKEPTKSKTGLLSAGDIGKLAGVPANTVHHWKDRDPSFPDPVDSPTAGDLYRRGAVVAWLRKTGRMK